jgi:hypothetical protein
MFRNRLFVLFNVVALLMVAAFAVGAAGATIAVVTPGRDVWYPSRADSINAADPSDYFQRHLDTLMSANAADLSDYFQRHTSADSLMSAANPSDYYERHPSSTLSGDTAGDLMRFGPPGR